MGKLKLVWQVRVAVLASESRVCASVLRVPVAEGCLDDLGEMGEWACWATDPGVPVLF